MMPGDAARKEFKKTRFLAIVLLALAPVVYIVIAGLLKSQGSVRVQSGGEIDMMFYILIVIALVSPTILPLIQKAQVSNYRAGKLSKASSAQLMTTLFLIKFSMVEAIFIYGLVVFFLSGDIQRMLVFYPIGAVWSVILWPREEKMKETIERLEAV